MSLYEHDGLDEVFFMYFVIRNFIGSICTLQFNNFQLKMIIKKKNLNRRLKWGSIQLNFSV